MKPLTVSMITMTITAVIMMVIITIKPMIDCMFSFCGRYVVAGHIHPRGRNVSEGGLQCVGDDLHQPGVGHVVPVHSPGRRPVACDLLSLSMTEDEKKAAYGDYVERGIISRADCGRWLKSGYDHPLLPLGPLRYSRHPACSILSGHIDRGEEKKARKVLLHEQ